jgi:ABC-type phosphate transport system permease subunit
MASFSVVLLTLGIVIVLIANSWLAIGQFGVWRFLVSTEWNR